MNNVYDAYSIEIDIGEKRSGKSLTGVFDTHKIITKNPKITVYSNMHLNKKYFPNFRYIKHTEIESFYESKEDFLNCIFLIDEVHILLDSRRFTKGGNVKIGYLIGQMGKRGNVFRCNTHFPNLIDIRLRMYCEKWNYISKGLIIKGEFYAIENNNKKLTKYEEDHLYIKKHSVIKKLVNFSFDFKELPPEYIKAKPVFNLYDSGEMIT